MANTRTTKTKPEERNEDQYPFVMLAILIIVVAATIWWGCIVGVEWATEVQRVSVEEIEAALANSTVG